MGGHGLWGDAPEKQSNSNSNHIKHPTNPAGRLGIINLQPSCACRTRLNPAPSVAGRPGGAGPADEREMLGVASGHAGDKSCLVMRSLRPSRRTRRLLAQANRRSGPVVGCQAAGDENKTTETDDLGRTVEAESATVLTTGWQNRQRGGGSAGNEAVRSSAVCPLRLYIPSQRIPAGWPREDETTA